jgi:hypothetical protein
MPNLRVAVFAAVVALGLAGAQAQDEAAKSSAMDALAAQATFHTDFTFDKSMLHAMSETLPDEDKPIAAKLNSVTVHNFRYSAPGEYDPAALDAVRALYKGNGWEHVGGHNPAAKKTGVAAPLDPTRTDVWVRTSGENLAGAVVLVANEKNVNLVYVDGVISPLDLLHLRGHFGIPKYQDDSQNQGPGPGGQR